jgi:steroid delta-isomerase-like uncharacterized protein
VAEQDAVAAARVNVDAFTAGDWDRFRAAHTPDTVYQDPAVGRVEGADRVTEAVQGWKRAFPDANGTITNAFASSDSVTLEITWEGTQSGTLDTPQGAIPPSGRRVNVPAAQVLTLQDGKIKENRHYFDLLTLLQQIGAAPQ